MPEARRDPARGHLAAGWWALLVFLSLGTVLEGLHGFKAAFYLDVDVETRRLLFRLAHTHGALLGVLHVGLAFTLDRLPWTGASRALASQLLYAATVLIPGGFLAGGLFLHGTDPGLGVLLVPPGALCLFGAVLLVALRTLRER